MWSCGDLLGLISVWTCQVASSSADCVLRWANTAALMRESTPPGDMEQASREVKGHMKSVRHRNFHQHIFVAITIAIVVDSIAVNIIHPSIHLSIHRILVIIMA